MKTLPMAAHRGGAVPSSGRRLEGARAKEEINDVAFVWLKPVELDGRNRAAVESVNVSGIDELVLPGLIFGDRRRNQGWSDLLEHLALGTTHHRRVREHVFGVGDLAVGRVAMNDPRPQIGAALDLDQARTELSGHITDTCFRQLLQD